MANNFTTTAATAATTTLPGYPRSMLREAAELAAGGKLPTGASLTLILRAAVERLCGAHDWAWLNVSDTLDLTADTDTVDLPADLADLLALSGNADNRFTFLPTSVAEIFRMRTVTSAITPVGMGTAFYYAVGTAAQTGVTAVPRYRLHLYPAPAETEADAVTIHYRKQVAPPAADADVIDVPPAAFHCLLEVVRAEASKAVLDGGKARHAVYEANEAAAERAIQRLIGRDGGEQTNLGDLTGGVGEEDRGVDHLYPSQISPA